jgi:ribosomal protein S18 acetylase RimI-like enzyme
MCWLYQASTSACLSTLSFEIGILRSVSAAPVVRRAVYADARALAELHVRSWQWAYREQLPASFLDALSATVDRREARRREVLAVPRSDQRTWVAEVSGKVVGFADTGPNGDDGAPPETAELYAIYLNEAVAGSGVGRALMQQATDDLRQRGYRQAILWVLEGNTRARRFYESAGWSADGASKTDTIQSLVLRELRYTIDLRSVAESPLH